MNVRIYTRSGCPYSAGAKRLLAERGLEFEEINVSEHPERRDEMIAAAGGSSTFPQVFIGGRHVGGYSELAELDRTRGIRDLASDDASRPA